MLKKEIDNKIKFFLFSFLFFTIPFFAFSASTFRDVTEKLYGSTVDKAITLIIALAVLFFFWGLVRFIFAAASGDSGGVTEGKKRMIRGLVILFVMFTVWGLLQIFQTTLNLDDSLKNYRDVKNNLPQ